MEITKTRDNDTLTIAIAGEIEAVNADELEQSMMISGRRSVFIWSSAQESL